MCCCFIDNLNYMSGVTNALVTDNLCNITEMKYIFMMFRQFPYYHAIIFILCRGSCQRIRWARNLVQSRDSLLVLPVGWILWNTL
jgi:hypothetical protein